MLFAPRAVDLDPVDLESALLRGAVGEFTAEAAVLLLSKRRALVACSRRR